MRKPRLVVVGGGVGGAAAVVELRREGFDGGITLISAENTVPYERLCVPKTLSTSCDQVIFVDQATDARLSSDAVLTEIDRLGERLQRRGAAQRAVRPVLIVVDLVLA